jgi:hypothetical protein
MPEPSSFGYGFSEHSFTSEGVSLAWTVTAQLWTIDRWGGELRQVDRERLFIGRLRGSDQPSISLDPLKGRRGFYRFDLQIANRNGNRIGSYSAYFKVVRPSWRPKLQLAQETLRPGQWLLARLENYGSEYVSYGQAFAVQRMERGQWVGAPDLIEHRWWAMWAKALGPGGVGGCNALLLPIDISPGTYRIVKDVDRGFVRPTKGRQLTAQFTVVAPAIADY